MVQNLFLKERKHENYYLLIMLDYKRADFKEVSKQLNLSRLSFANEEELYFLLALNSGEVTPFGLLNDTDKIVNAILDNELENCKYVSFHPNTNTSTLVLRYKDFERYLEWSNNTVESFDLT